MKIEEDAPFSEFEQFLQDNLIDGKLTFDGIFCVTDKLAFDIIKTLRRMGQRVPEDVQVIGYDGLRMFGDMDYYCSTIVQPVEAMAETCVNLVLGESSANTSSYSKKEKKLIGRIYEAIGLALADEALREALLNTIEKQITQ